MNQLQVRSTSGQSVESTQMRQQNMSDYNYNKIFMDYRISIVPPQSLVEKYHNALHMAKQRVNMV